MRKIEIILKQVKKHFKKFITKYVRPFFFSTKSGEDERDSIKAVYTWSTLFLSLTMITVAIYLTLVWDAYKKQLVPPADLTIVIGLLCGLVLGLIGVYNNGKKK